MYGYARVNGSASMSNFDDVRAMSSGNPLFRGMEKLELCTAIEIARKKNGQHIVFFLFFERVVFGATFGQMLTLGIFSPIC